MNSFNLNLIENLYWKLLKKKEYCFKLVKPMSQKSSGRGRAIKF